MVQNHYSLNVARDGSHYAKITMPMSFNRDDARQRAEEISKAFRISMPDDNWNFSLSHIECFGKIVKF